MLTGSTHTVSQLGCDGLRHTPDCLDLEKVLRVCGTDWARANDAIWPMKGTRGKQWRSSEKLLGYTQQATLRIVIPKQLNKGNPSILMSLFNGFGTLQHRPHVGLLLSIHILVSLRICPHPPGVKFHHFEDPNTKSNSETICTKLSARNYA